METTIFDEQDEESLLEAQIELLRPLTGRQQQFVLAYVGKARFNQTKAAQLAGYSDPNAIVWKLMSHPGIKAALDGFLATQVMGAQEILSRLDQQARLDVSEFFDFVEGNTEGDWQKIVFNATKAQASGKMHLIKGFEYSKNGDLQVVFHDAQAALTLLGKHNKLFTERVEHSGSLDLSNLSDDELERLAAGKSVR